MTDTNPHEPPKRNRWLKPLLFLSLALNLAIAGIVLGAFLSPDGPRKDKRDEFRSLRGVIGAPFFQALPKDARRSMVGEVMANRDTFRENRETLNRRVESFLAALRAEEFDRAEVSRLLLEQRDAASKRQDMGERFLLDRLEEMSQAERAAYADRLEERLPGFRRR